MSIHGRFFFFLKSSYLLNKFLKVNYSRSKHLNPSGHCPFLSVLWAGYFSTSSTWETYLGLKQVHCFVYSIQIITNEIWDAGRDYRLLKSRVQRFETPIILTTQARATCTASLDCEDHNLFERFSQSVAFIPKWISSEIRSSFQWHLTNCLLFSESLSKRQPFENNLLSQEAFHISFSMARSFRLIVKSVTPLSLSLSLAQAYVLIQNVFLRLRDAQAEFNG